MLKYFFITFLILYGPIHLIGFVKEFKLAELKQLNRDISRPARLFWLFTAIIFIIAAFALLAGKFWWWMPATLTMTFEGLTALGIFTLDENGDVAGFKVRRDNGSGSMQVWKAGILVSCLMDINNLKVSVSRRNHF